MKMIVETTGAFQLMGTNGTDFVPFDRPAVVAATGYIHTKAAKGDVRILRNDLPAVASDEEFEKHWLECQGDLELAIESYVATLPAAEPAPAPEAKQARGKKNADVPG